MKVYSDQNGAVRRLNNTGFYKAALTLGVNSTKCNVELFSTEYY